LKSKKNYQLIIGSAVAAAIVGILGLFFPKIQQICCQPPVELAEYKNSAQAIGIKHPKNWTKQAGAFPFISCRVKCT
jgi:hypothetical protein